MTLSMLLPLQGALVFVILLPRVLPWAIGFYPFGAYCFDF